MRRMNKVKIVSPHRLELGPGSTWDRVLKLVPPEHYTIIHGQCKSVGIGGYITGGGINVVGTSEKYGTAGDHVMKYTMVDAVGNILHVRFHFFCSNFIFNFCTTFNYCWTTTIHQKI